jgi:UDP-N-acetylglucosamine:LPS N-acetylglucosamine transferase
VVLENQGAAAVAETATLVTSDMSVAVESVERAAEVMAACRANGKKKKNRRLRIGVL